jgi:DNA-binding transcriptional MerR regulator/methylmalonyl-CoA mutase cobalamin-binding subunit
MAQERSDKPRHPIRVVSRRTGLTPALLRAWEKRYGVVTPSRSEGGQRLYSDEDVHRLGLLQRAVEEGRNISQVARLSLEELEGLVEEDHLERIGRPSPGPLDGGSVIQILDEARRAVREMDPRELERVLTRGAMAVSVTTLIDDIVIPLVDGIGSAWERGQLGPAHEHVASVVIRRFLEWLLDTVDVGETAPILVAATPTGERHELGALLAAVTASAGGWKTVYLGPDLPASEIASTALRLGAQVVALSLVDPGLIPSFPEEIMELYRALPPSVRLVVGGPGKIIGRLEEEVEGPELMTSLSDLRRNLRNARL